jgi:hypothetical protein
MTHEQTLTFHGAREGRSCRDAPLMLDRAAATAAGLWRELP